MNSGQFILDSLDVIDSGSCLEKGGQLPLEN